MSKSPSPPTTAQSLGPLLKSARNILRKDKGIDRGFDRLAMRNRRISHPVEALTSQNNKTRQMDFEEFRNNPTEEVSP